MMELRKELRSLIFNSCCPSLGISISTSCDSSNSSEESIVEDAYRVEGGMVAKMQEVGRGRKEERLKKKEGGEWCSSSQES